MRSVAITILALVTAVACSSTAKGTGTSSSSTSSSAGASSSSGGSGGVGGIGGVSGGPGGSGSCDGACAHYLECKGADTPDNRAQCTQDCNGLGLTADQLANFEAADCETAIAAVEGSSSGGTSSSGTSSSSGSSGSPDCKGCTWDGSSCIYLTGSNGDYFNCDGVCCPGH